MRKMENELSDSSRGSYHGVMTSGIVIRSLTVRYDGFEAVSGLDLEVSPGEILGLLGPNGAGKTTTIRAVSGMLRPDEGTVSIAGADTRTNGDEARARLSFVPDRPHLYELLTAWEYLEFVAGLWSLPDGWQGGAEAHLRTFSLFDVRHDLLESYSQGMRQKILLVAGLIHAPSAWVLDEPMSGLDPRAARLMRDVLRREAGRGCAILLSTHTLDIAERMCDRIAIIDRGRKIAEGTLDELRRSDAGGGAGATQAERLEDLFLRLTEAGDEDAAAEALV